MFDKRLFALAPGLGKLIAGKVACMWVGLLANISLMASMVGLLAGLLAAADPHAIACALSCPVDAADCMAGCPTNNLFDMPGRIVLPAPNIVIICGVVLAVCLAVRYRITAIAARLGTEAAERVKLALRSKLYRKMLALGPSYNSKVSTADVVQSAGEGVEQIQSFFELFLPQLCYALLAPLTLFVVIAQVDLPAALTMLLIAPLIIIVTGLVSMTAARAFKQYWGRYTDMGAAFLDNLQGLETLKAFDADDRAAAEMDARAENFRVMTMRVLQIQLRSLTAMDVVAYGGAAAGIGVALWQYMTANNALQLTGLLFIVLLSAEFFIPMRQLGSYFHIAMNGMTSAKRIFALLDAPEPEYGNTQLPDGAAGFTVTFEHVAYAYGDAADTVVAHASAPAHVAQTNTSSEHSGAEARGVSSTSALVDASFTAKPGQITAIVGVSGSGKSTAAALLAGALTGYAGSIRVAVAGSGSGAHEERDDAAGMATASSSWELRTLSGASLTQAVTLIGARSHLFAGTLRDNLMMALPSTDVESENKAGEGQAAASVQVGNPDRDSAYAGGQGGAGNVERRLWKALESARIADFVRMQPDGLDMPIESDASNLSGGQRQRIAIARALLHNSPVVVLDEATSSVDSHSEGLILDTIRELAHRGTTVIMITHRMANAELADHVVVFDHGRTVESGAHRELMGANGMYARLFRAQRDIEHFGIGREPADPAPKTTIAAAPTGRTPTIIEAHVATGSALTTPQLIMRLLREASPLAGLMAAASVAGVIGHVAATFLPVFGVVAMFALAGNPVWGMGAGLAFAAMIVCALLRGVMRYVEQYLNHNVAFRLLAFFRSKAFAALRRLAPAKLAGHGKGDLIAMLTTDVELLEIFFAHTISPVVIAVSTTIIYAVAAATLHPWMALLLVAAHLVIGVLVPRFFATSARNLGPAIRGRASALDDVMLDDMRGLSEIIRFGCGERRAQAIEDRTRELWAQHAALSRVNGRFAGVGGLLVSLLTIAAAALAIALAATWPYAIPSLITAFTLLASSFGPTMALAALPANLTQTFASARRLFALMDEPPAVVETGTEMPAYAGMRMEHVTFGYAPDASVTNDNGEAGRQGVADGNVATRSIVPVLSGCLLEVPERGVLGVQGPSGRGKSTMLKLLMRYWDPQIGSITMSGVPLPAIDAHHRRCVQAMMTQETHLFDGTIRDNLVMALPHDPNGNVRVSAESPVAGADSSDLDALLREACRKASVLDFIDSLPDGLDTQVGELGGRLSEGERQRIGLARVFLRRADMVLFDEPTSRLDALNEAVILRSIDELAHGQTGDTDDVVSGTAVVLVSHRPSAMRIADRVIAL